MLNGQYAIILKFQSNANIIVYDTVYNFKWLFKPKH